MDSNNDAQNQRQTLYATITGRVQGVGFRAFVYNCARRLQLAGYVRNGEDGSVYVVAVGRREALEQLLQALHRGPSMSRVQHVEASWSEGEASVAARAGQGFEVRG